MTPPPAQVTSGVWACWRPCSRGRVAGGGAPPLTRDLTTDLSRGGRGLPHPRPDPPTELAGWRRPFWRARLGVGVAGGPPHLQLTCLN
ncbi:hypothetical protein CRG98_004479 [Punica granatum]|uniref:Uncharacterized protein n=1 Tax=Punica granatum TaxID=22663 RepID=A0A2I0L382_PUNGR|nr:hypothetical protein CRG98_004479 [Punica granatum]